jgi:HEAT repeats
MLNRSVYCSSLFVLLLLVTTGVGQPPPVLPMAKPPATPPTAPVAPAMPAAPTAAPMNERVWPKEVGGKDLKGWLAELKDSPDGSLRELAVKAIPEFGPSIRKEVLQPMLTALRKETDPGVKVNLLIVLGNIGPEDADDGKKLADQLKLVALNSPQGSPYRLHAARGLANCFKYAIDAIPELAKVLDDSAWETRRTAAHAIGLIAKPNEKRPAPPKFALDAIRDRLKLEKTVPVRLELVQSLVMMGPPAFANPNDYVKVIEPYYKVVLEQQKEEKDKATLVWFYVLIMLYDGSQLNDSTIQKIADFLPQPDANGRIAALRALALLDDRAKTFLPNIANALNHPDPYTASEAIQSLAAMGTTAKSTLPDLEKFKAATKDEIMKDLATQAIEIISGKKNPAAPAPPPPAKP